MARIARWSPFRRDIIMLSFRSINAGSDAAGAAAYYEELAREDYYVAGGEPPGVWIGQFAERLDLHGQTVERGQLLTVLQGYHPITHEALHGNAGPAHKPGYDFTFSAPKSVSITWGVSDSETRHAISVAQREAVEAALAHAERIGAFSQREGHGGAIRVPHGELLAAAFEHSTSRAGDVNLHTHSVIANISGNGKTVDFDARYKLEIGAAYRFELAQRLEALGYAIERDKFSFKIADVPDALVRDQSSRTIEITAYLQKRGIDPNSKASDSFKLDTRQGKSEVDRTELFSSLNEKARHHGLDPATLQHAGEREVHRWSDAEFLREAFQQASTLTDSQLRAAAFVYAQDRAGAVPKDAVKTLAKEGGLIELHDAQGGRRWTSKEMLAIERGLAESARRMAEVSIPMDQSRLAESRARHGLNDEQHRALLHIASHKLALVQGAAGTGKSRMVDAAREFWEGQGKRIIGVALAGKAARNLAESAHLDKSMTIDRLLSQSARGIERLDQRTVLVADEAGMVGSRKLSALMAEVERSGAELKLIGDPRQLQPIDAGGAFRLMIANVGAATIDTVMRQRSEQDRQIVAHLAEGRVALALGEMRKAGMLHEHRTMDAARRAVAERTIADIGTGRSAIIMTGTRSEAYAVNLIARDLARRAGQLSGSDVTFTNGAGEQRQIAVGERVMFTRNSSALDIDNGATGTITGISTGRVTVALDSAGRNVHIDLEKYPHIEHGYAYTTHKSQGLTVDIARALVDQSMLDRSLGYVQASRHRESFELHGTRDQMADLGRILDRDRSKDVSTDYQIARALQPAARPGNEQSLRQSVAELRDTLREGVQQAVNWVRSEIAELRTAIGLEQHGGEMKRETQMERHNEMQR